MKNISTLILIVSILFSHVIYSQSISKKEIRNTYWFSINKDSLFYKSDTIRLIKYSNRIEHYRNSDFYEESEYFDDTQCIQISFKRNKYLYFVRKNFHMYSLSLKKWFYDKKNSTLKIYGKKGDEQFYKIISINEIEFGYQNEKFRTKEMLLIRK